MFERLAAAIDELDERGVPVDGAALIELLGLADRIGARVVDAVGEVDAAGLFQADGAVSMTAWLGHHGRRSHRDAHRLVSTARRLRHLPVTREAFAAGILSAGHVDAVVANVSEAKVELFAGHEPALVPTLADLGVADTAVAMRVWSLRADDLLGGEARPERPGELYLSPLLDGRRQLNGHLDPETGELVATALRVAESPDVDGEPVRTPSQRRQDALGDICRWFLDHQDGHQGGRHRPHLNVIVDLDTLEGRGRGRLLDGTPLEPVSVQRLLCDAGVHRVVTAGRSAILDYGTTTRTIPAPLWNALVIRDRHCRFPGCDRPPHWCEGHDVIWYRHGGPTRLDNLALLCSRHHHLLHQPGWQATLTGDATLEVTHPYGRVLTSHPPPTPGQLHVA